MTDKKDSALPDNTDQSSDSTSTSSSSANTSTPQAQKRPGKTLPTLALLAGVAALGLSGWQYYQDNYLNADQDLEAAQAKITQLETKLSTLDRSVTRNSDSASQVAALIDNMAQTQAQVAETKLATEQSLVELSSKINKLSNADKNDWLLAEAQYLVRLANQRLLLEKDTRSTIMLLTNADSILESLEDPLVFDTRKAIASDIQALKSVAAFDLEGRYLQLAALYDQVAQLPQREPSKAWQAQRNDETEQDSAPGANNASAVKRLFTEAWQGIKSLVVVNYNQKPIKPLLPPAEYQELVTGIQLQLDVAQVALMKGEDAIYEKALSRVAEVVTQHFDTNSQVTIAFTTTLTSLQQVNPNPDVPMPRASLQAMKKLMQNWNNSAAGETAGGTSE
ncbi:uroporphyrinogen-III C-methyltransferase [Marinomonas ostreistagni]|uniref:uroporphyrinogen-III C-methyltransferase n=1 Tax=Marinomonas ostreistagni TaxID=359209 RepID=UPI00194E18EE|nr:uroporphyrinogen-III C-methyltransferase [Marinomonas ostreistagni]MBM6551612.1 uroporphyrinogen-III C-methyltransferase [Marinomonas ostreistagni]